MAVIILGPGRRFRSPYRRRSGRAGTLAVVAVGAALAAGGAKAAASHAHSGASHRAVTTAAVPASGSEGAFMAAVLADLGAPVTAANVSSLEAWTRRETPWPPVAANNAMNTTLTAPGSTAFNYLPGGGSVQNYPTAAEGAQANASTLLGGYPLIVSALRSGSGVCGTGFTAEFSRWSGGGYQEVC